MSEKEYTVLGIMSGSSLDGIDLALCRFTFEEKWSYKWIKTETINFSDEWNEILRSLPNSTQEEIAKQHISFGQYLGETASLFLIKNDLKANLIASHGHTLFHQPEAGYTFQLGHGQAIASSSGITTISNFRQKDILNGGQGAPLVPIGDLLLFPEISYCLNIGGIANISIKGNNSIKGFDICPANQLLNYLSNQLGKEYDYNGEIAKSGTLNPALYESLNNVSFYQKSPPKSLGNEDVKSIFLPLLEQCNASVADMMYTVVKHITNQIGKITGNNPNNQVLVTGGGAHNQFLIDRLKKESPVQWIIPEKRLIDFKEALIFAFMGALRFEGQINCLASVTGAKNDSSCGDIHFP